jgi:hypothetical protein
VTAFAALLAICAASAFAALLFSGSRFHRMAGHLARASLWLTLAASLAAALDIALEPAPPGANEGIQLFARGVSLLVKQVAALVPTALMATFALRRSRAVRSR